MIIDFCDGDNDDDDDGDNVDDDEDILPNIDKKSGREILNIWIKREDRPSLKNMLYCLNVDKNEEKGFPFSYIES